jgi:hypothetical protein
MPDWGKVMTGTDAQVDQGAATGAATGFSVGGGPWGALVGGVIGGGSALFGEMAGEDAAAKARREQEALYQKALTALQGADIESKDAWANQVEDPTGRDAQLKALNDLMGIGEAGGMDQGTLASLRLADQDAAQQEQSQREAALSSLAQRGGLGSAQELSARVAGVQTGANARATAGAKVVSDARQRALEALSQAGQLGTQVRSGDYQFMSGKDNAANYINTFNASQRLNRAQSEAQLYQGMAGGAANWGQQQQKYYTGLGVTGAQAAQGAGAGLDAWMKNRGVADGNGYSGETPMTGTGGAPFR